MSGMIEMSRGNVAPRASRGPDGWGVYLLLAVALAPVVVPTGPAQLSILDPFNLIAMGCFAAAFLVRRGPLRAPFAAAVLVISIGSLVAVVNAESVSASVLAMVQDAYLYLWFVVLVNVMSGRGDLIGLRLAWMWVADAVALYGLGAIALHGHVSPLQMLGPRGMRAIGTFSNPNMFADYLGLSLFIVLSLSEHLGRVVRWGSIAVLLVAIAATKSIGGALSLATGLAVWALVRARTLRLPAPALAAAALLAASVLLAAFGLNAGAGLGEDQLRRLREHSFAARLEHSEEGRLKIWGQLQQTYARSPLGLGPGNSRWVTLSVEQRERPNSMYSKEAHNDYLAYAIERGPLAALALLVLLGQAFWKISSGWRGRVRAGTADRAASALAAGLAGALACSVAHSFTLERLHLRHFWLLLAMVCALAEAAGTTAARARRPAPDRASSPAPALEERGSRLAAAGA